MARVAPADAGILCVDIGGTSTKAGVLENDSTLRFVESIPTAPSAASFLNRLTELIEQTIATAAAAGRSTLPKLGVAVAGFLDSDRAHLLYNSNLPWLEGYPLRQHLQERFPGLTIELEVDSNAATMAEYHFGSGQGSRRFLCLTCGTGLGVGMTVDGIPLRFAYGCMGDIGHTVVMRDGPLCTCGGRGCAEALISATSLADNYRKQAGIVQEISLRDVINASQSGDAAATRILVEAGEWLGVALASMANTFFPDHIAIAGGLSTAGPSVLEPAERVFREAACLLARSKATLSAAALGSTATLIGAAWPFWRQKEF